MSLFEEEPTGKSNLPPHGTLSSAGLVGGALASSNLPEALFNGMQQGSSKEYAALPTDNAFGKRSASHSAQSGDRRSWSQAQKHFAQHQGIGGIA